MTTTLITGSARGIGLALCRLLAERKHTVIAACREPSSELKALATRGVRIESGVDVAKRETLVALSKRLHDTRLDWLFANAGILAHESLSAMTPSAVEAIETQFRVNALGTLLTVAELAPHLAPGAKVALVTSRMGSIGDNTSGGYYGYRMSKAALNAAGVSLAHDLRPRGISLAILHPGYVRTDMTSGAGQLEPEDSARLLIERVEALTPDTSGTFWHANGERLPW